jgi:hypothetical protein
MNKNNEIKNDNDLDVYTEAPSEQDLDATTNSPAKSKRRAVAAWLISGLLHLIVVGVFNFNYSYPKQEKRGYHYHDFNLTYRRRKRGGSKRSYPCKSKNRSKYQRNNRCTNDDPNRRKPSRSHGNCQRNGIRFSRRCLGSNF